jgi:3-isopropylmalate dehydrogenase
VDYAAYLMMQDPQRFDVLVTPNLLGDVLADLGAIYLGSRGLSYSANYSASGHAVYQTGHGAAKDLAGTDRANPVGQILSMAMMLRESYCLHEEASLIERAVDHVYAQGYRTDDLPEPHCRRVGTRQMADLVAQAVMSLGRAAVPA